MKNKSRKSEIPVSGTGAWMRKAQKKKIDNKNKHAEAELRLMEKMEKLGHVSGFASYQDGERQW